MERLIITLWPDIVYRKIPILGKHTKKITCGAWSRENLLALGSDDRSVSVSNADGDTLCQVALRAEPTNIQFSEMKGDERSATGQNTVPIALQNCNTVFPKKTEL